MTLLICPVCIVSKDSQTETPPALCRRLDKKKGREGKNNDTGLCFILLILLWWLAVLGGRRGARRGSKRTRMCPHVWELLFLESVKIQQCSWLKVLCQYFIRLQVNEFQLISGCIIYIYINGQQIICTSSSIVLKSCSKIIKYVYFVISFFWRAN